MPGEQSTGRAVAARHRWIWETNRKWVGRQSRAQCLDLLSELARVRYREREVPDTGATLREVVGVGAGDCEDLCAAWHALLEVLLPHETALVSLLIPGWRPGWWHVVMRVGNRWFDPSVDAGMRPIPPQSAYSEVGAVVISERERTTE